MPFLLATSCLQGRPIQDACRDLLVLQPDGLQGCAGNAPMVGTAAFLEALPVSWRTHQGFSIDSLRQPVWSKAFELQGTWDSVHTPRDAPADWLPPPDVCVEVMYPGYPVGSGLSVLAAMEAGVRLAVDVSHVYLQLQQGAMTPTTWSKLQDYDRVEEVHVSHNDGRRDRHRPLQADTFGLPWARERAEAGTPVVLESYLHRLTDDARREQFDLLRTSCR